MSRLRRLTILVTAALFFTVGTNIRHAILLTTTTLSSFEGDTMSVMMAHRHLDHLAFLPSLHYTGLQEGQSQAQSQAQSQQAVAEQQPPQPPLVRSSDSIYILNNNTRWDSSPVVMEEYKFIFFPTPPATLWKRLFRRMYGYDDWATGGQPHNPEQNGLKYLWSFNESYASDLMTRPDFTRAIFVRDPKEKFATLFTDTIEKDDGKYVIDKCCPRTKDCLAEEGIAVAPDHVLELIKTCHDPRWTPQYERMESKYWPYINFVGHWDTVDEDSKRLMSKLGIWNLFGKDGWGANGENSLNKQLAIIYQPKRRKYQTKQFYKTKVLERLVEDVYKKDYESSLFGFERTPIVEPMDFIYERDLDKWDASPVVVEEYNLVFFTVPKVACTTFKFLFRRIRGHDDWNVQDMESFLPHNPKKNKLKYLWDYPLEEANRMMTSPNWTRAIFVRDPKERFLSAFLDKAMTNPGFIATKCCKTTKSCVVDAQTPLGFWHLIQTCDNAHWSPQHYRMERKYWPYINFVGHFETLEVDAKRLLQKIGAWDTYGTTGWGPDGDLSIFQKRSNTQSHVTNAKEQASQWFTPELERLVETYYDVDYSNKALGFVKTNLTGMMAAGNHGRDSNANNAGGTIISFLQSLIGGGGV